MHTKRSSYAIRAWSIWLLSAFFMFYKYALEVSPSVMTDTLMRTFHISGAELGSLAACYFYAYLLLQLPAGILIDKFGPRKTTTVAIIVCALGSILFARSDSVWIASIGRFLTGAGAAFAAVNCLKLTASWFPLKQFAFMAGLMMTVAMLGAVGGQAPLAEWIRRSDWRTALENIGFIGLVFSLLFWAIVKDRSPGHVIAHRLAPPPLPLTTSLKKILLNPQSWWLSIYSGFAFAPVMIFGGLWGVCFLREGYRLPETIAAQMVSLIFIGFAVGAPVFGWVSDWLKKRCIVMFFGTLGALITISLVLYATDFAKDFLVPLLFLFGFSISSFLLCFTMIREISLPILAATAIGFMNAFDALFGAVSDPLTGKFLDLMWNGTTENGARIFSLEAYQIALFTIPIYLIIALLSFLKIEETHCRPTYPNPLP